MDVSAWIALGVIVALGVAGAAATPALLRDARRRRERGGGGSLGGISGGMDAIWRPTADEAHAQWQAQLEVPAPAPTPGDRGDLDDGPLVIEFPR
ncbi:MAG TPA: hypothetical protein VFY91_12430 [Microbacterium sp.]|nr:hypothetical protein [Microbacterium sp.]